MKQYSHFFKVNSLFHLLSFYFFFFVSSDEGAANRRKQLIEESKYLGGDMEHTHLVKGLDYALLQKVSDEWVCQTEGWVD